MDALFIVAAAVEDGECIVSEDPVLRNVEADDGTV